MANEKKEIAIIGLGASGVVTFYELVHRITQDADRHNYKITLIEKSKTAGGIAYGEYPNEEHIQNVNIGQMSALFEANDPAHEFNLKTWLNKKRNGGREWQDNNFCPCKEYGNYLIDILKSAIEKAENNNIEVHLCYKTKVIDIELDQNLKPVLTYEADDNNKKPKKQNIDHCILAIGNDFSSKKLNKLENIYDDENYHHDLWKKDHEVINNVSKFSKKNVLIIGTGLSAMDVLRSIGKVWLEQEEECGNITLISRHGLLHEVYFPENPQTVYEREKFFLQELNDNTATIEDILLYVNNLDKNHQPKSSDELKIEWSDIGPYIKEKLSFLLGESEINSYKFRESNDYLHFRRLLRVIKHQRFPKEEKNNIIKHLDLIKKSHIETMVTGMPFETGKLISDLLKIKRLEIYASQIESVEKVQSGVNNVFQVTFSNNNMTKNFDVIINALGADYNISNIKDENHLLKKMYAKRLISPSDFDIGFKTDEGHPVDGNGDKICSISVVGPTDISNQFTKVISMSTAKTIISIREQCYELAKNIAKDFGIKIPSSEKSFEQDKKAKCDPSNGRSDKKISVSKEFSNKTNKHILYQQLIDENNTKLEANPYVQSEYYSIVDNKSYEFIEGMHINSTFVNFSNTNISNGTWLEVSAKDINIKAHTITFDNTKLIVQNLNKITFRKNVISANNFLSYDKYKNKPSTISYGHSKYIFPISKYSENPLNIYIQQVSPIFTTENEKQKLCNEANNKSRYGHALIWASLLENDKKKKNRGTQDIAENIMKFGYSLQARSLIDLLDMPSEMRICENIDNGLIEVKKKEHKDVGVNEIAENIYEFFHERRCANTIGDSANNSEDSIGDEVNLNNTNELNTK